MNIHAQVHLPREKLYQCQRCGKKYWSEKRFSEHTRKINCLLASQQNQDEFHIKRKIGKRLYQCQFCVRSYKYELALEYHERNEHPELVQNRDVASKMNTRPPTLQNQNLPSNNDNKVSCTSMQNENPTPKPNSCLPPVQNHSPSAKASPDMPMILNQKGHTAPNTDCPPPTVSEKPAATDSPQTNSGELPHKSEVCQKSFSRNSAEINKRKTHTAAFPYECNVCHKRFSCSSVRAIHKRIHDNQEVASKPSIQFPTFQDQDLALSEDHPLLMQNLDPAPTIPSQPPPAPSQHPPVQNHAPEVSHHLQTMLDQDPHVASNTEQCPPRSSNQTPASLNHPKPPCAYNQDKAIVQSSSGAPQSNSDPSFTPHSGILFGLQDYLSQVPIELNAFENTVKLHKTYKKTRRRKNCTKT